MKRVLRACWHRSLGLHPALVIAMGLVCFSALVFGLTSVLDKKPAPTGVLHAEQVERLVLPGGSFAPAAQQLDPAALQGAWSTVQLPLTWAAPAASPGQTPAYITWLRIPLQALPVAADGLYLYLPRWQAEGRMAVYADTQLLYRSTGDLVLGGFNQPLWLALDADASQSRPHWLYLRIDSRVGAAGAVSSVWIGPAHVLWPRYQLRRWLQTGVAETLGRFFLGVGAFSLAIWLLRRDDRTYLLFALFTVLWVVRGLRFHWGADPLPLPVPWFGWLSINTGNALLVTWYVFVSSLVPTAPRWPVRALSGLLLASSVVTLPWVSGFAGLHALAPLPYLVTILAGVPSSVLMAWYAWRYRGREGIVAAAIGLLQVPVAAHDWMMQNFYLSPEDIYAWPFSTAGRLLMFSYVILTRFATAVSEVELANARLAERLREREAELAYSYEQLRSAQQRQVLSQERQRLMQDIHDGMGSQLMSALKVAEAGQLTEATMARVLRECIDDLKLTVDSLEPVEADLLLLLATLRYRMAPRLAGAGLHLVWEVVDVPPLDWLDPRSALHVLRILQEGISNILQHSGASTLRVTTTEADGGVLVCLVDNGRGFQAPPAEAAGHGLSNIFRRAQAIGGRVQWDRVAEGNRLRLWLPLHAKR